MSSQLTRLLTITLFTFALVTFSVPAQATFPSPNGKIAFVHGPDIYTVNPNGTELRQLTAFTGDASSFFPNWSPDGHQIVFSEYDTPTAPGQIWIMNSDGTNQHRLFIDPKGYDNEDASFSPDGRHLVFQRCGLSCAVFRINADGSGLTAITHFDPNPDVLDLFPAYSPDGKTIAFTGFARGGYICAVYLVDANGANVRLLTPPELLAYEGDWTPAGTQLAIGAHVNLGIHGQNEELWIINANGSHPHKLTNNNLTVHGYFSAPHDYDPSYSPQGDQIAFQRWNDQFTSVSVMIISANGTAPAVSIPLPLASSATIFHKLAVAPVQGKAMATARARRLVKDSNWPRWGPAL